MALVVTPLNNFLGPAGDTVTAQKCSTKHYSQESGKSGRGNLARTPDVAVVIPLKLVFGPCG